MRWYLRKMLFREPFGGPVGWWMLASGCFSLLVGLFLTLSEGLSFLLGPMSIASGLMFVSGGASELLSKERKTAIMLLRLASLLFIYAGFILALAVIVVEITKV